MTPASCKPAGLTEASYKYIERRSDAKAHVAPRPPVDVIINPAAVCVALGTLLDSLEAMSFRLWTIFYVFALFAAAMATFGPLGIVAAAAVSTIWFVIHSKHWPKTVLESVVVIAVLLVLVALCLPALEMGRESSRLLACRNHLNVLARSLFDYESKNGTFPPAAIADESGTPLHSWRSMILPQLERTDIYESIDRSLAWDAPVNRAATSTDIHDYVCPSDQASPAGCSYFAVVGPHTAWPGTRGRSMREITDAKSHTILLIESYGHKTPWAKPSDLTFDEAIQLLSDKSSRTHLHRYRPSGALFPQLLGKAGAGIHVVMADGSVHFLALPIPKDLAEAILTVDGGEGDLHYQLDDYIRPRLDYGKCYALAVFVVLSLIPAMPLMWRTRAAHQTMPPLE